MNEIITQRKEHKKKKPHFIQQDSHKKKGVPQKWRKPRGRHSKMRLQLRSYHRCPKVGWGSPGAVKGLHPKGLEIMMVHTLSELDHIDNTKQGIILGSGVGMKKKMALLEAAQSKNITLLNVKNIEEYKKQMEQKITARREKKNRREKTKEEVKAAKKKEVKEEKKEATEKEKKEQEKKEKDKLLIKKQ